MLHKEETSIENLKKYIWQYIEWRSGLDADDNTFGAVWLLDDWVHRGENNQMNTL